MDVLGQKSIGVAARENRFEQFPRFVLPADLMERVDVPEVAREKRGLRRAEIVRRGVTHDPAVARELPANGVAGLDEAGIARGQESELGDQEDAGVEIRRAEGAGQGASLFIPAFFENSLAQRARVGRPVFGAVGDFESARNAGEPVAGRPAQRRRIGVRQRAGAIFPQARIGLESMHNGALAKTLEQPEQRFVAHLGQTLVDEHLRRGENDAAVNVVLPLARRLVADPNRAHAEKALEVRRDPFLKRRKGHDAMQRLYLFIAASRWW